MKNPRSLKGLCIAVLCSVTFLFPSTSFSQQKLIQVDGWNAYVHLPWDYDLHPDLLYPTIFFIPGLGEVGTSAAKLISNGPGAYLNQGWNGNVKVGEDSVKFIVISLQPTGAWPGVSSVASRLEKLKTLYRLGDINITGLSMGGWAAMKYATANTEYAKQAKTVVSVEGVNVADGGDILPTFKPYATENGKLLAFEQAYDFRWGDSAVMAMNHYAPGSSQFVYTEFNGGGHCCWSKFYGGGGAQPTIFNLQGIGQNIYEWIGRKYLTTTRLLPVILDKISIQANRKNININWSTSTEINSDHFEVQRSSNGRDFETIGVVNAAGNSSIVLNYSFTDEVPAKGTNFYRLNMVDIDNSNSISKTVSAEAGFTNSFLVKNVSLSTHNHQLKFTLESHDNQKINMTVYDVNGKIYNQSVLALATGTNTIQKSVFIESHGIYYLSLKSGDKVMTQPLFAN